MYVQQSQVKMILVHPKRGIFNTEKREDRDIMNLPSFHLVGFYLIFFQ